MALLFLIILIVPTVLALREAVRQPYKRKLATILLGVLAIGAADLALHVYYFIQSTCGDKYYPDIGCLYALPDWLGLLGFVTFVVALVLSIVIIFLPSHTQRSK